MQRKNQKKLLLALSVLLISVALVGNVSAASISPSSASAILNMPTPFSCSGLNSGSTYDVKLDDTLVHDDLSPSSDGTLSFNIVPTSAGSHSVKVYENSTTLVATASLSVTDVFATVIPAVVLFVGFTILFGIAKEMEF